MQGGRREQHEAEELAKIDALRHATSEGLTDLERGRFIEIDSDKLGELLAGIGEQADCIGIANPGT